MLTFLGYYPTTGYKSGYTRAYVCVCMCVHLCRYMWDMCVVSGIKLSAILAKPVASVHADSFLWPFTCCSGLAVALAAASLPAATPSSFQAPLLPLLLLLLLALLTKPNRNFLSRRVKWFIYTQSTDPGSPSPLGKPKLERILDRNLL